jgi:hypothetical protein
VTTRTQTTAHRHDGTTARDRLAELHEQLADGVQALTETDGWQRMLDTAARFPRYSARNVLLIMLQRPDATHVAGYRVWQSLGRNVKRGERSIGILAPCVYRPTSAAPAGPDETERPAGKQDPAARRVLRGFRVASVFDITQTEGDPLPDLAPPLLDGDCPAALWDGIAAHIAEARFTLTRDDCSPANGRTNYDTRTVAVRPDLSDAQATKTAIHELAHCLMHQPGSDRPARRDLIEVEAESVAYIVCHASGLHSETYSLPYVAGWASEDPAAIQATSERVITAAHTILDRFTATTAPTASH